MKKFRIEAEALRQHYGRDVRLRDVVAEIRRELAGQKLVVCFFCVDQREWHLEDEARNPDLWLSQVKSLEYSCDSERALLRDQVEAWVGALEELLQRNDETASALQASRTEATLADAGDFLDHAEELLPILTELREALSPYHSGSQTKMDQLERMTRQTVGQAREAFLKQDFVLLMQLLEYDLGHGLEQWRGLFVGFRSLLEAGEHVRTGHDPLARRRLAN